MARVLMLMAMSVSALAAGCKGHEFEPPDREGQVQQAETRFDLASFDSVGWASDSVRSLQGNVVWATYCRNCHGSFGRGATDYAVGRGLEVPSLVEPGWRFEGQRDSVLHRIFVGHARGMPTWGVAGITPREMDAVSHYLLAVLRPEAAADGSGNPNP